MIFSPSLRKIAKWEKDRNGEALTKALSNNDFEIKIAAINAIGNIQYQIAGSSILNLLSHPISPKIRRASAVALGKMKAQFALDKLIKTLGDDDNEVRDAAKESLISIGEATAPKLVDRLADYYEESVRNACFEILKLLGRESVDHLIVGLREGNLGVRVGCARLLGDIGDSRSHKALIKALADEGVRVRKASAEALKNMGWQPGDDVYAVHFYIATNQPEEVYRRGPEAIPALETWLSDEDMVTRRNVAIGLKKLNWRPKTRQKAVEFWAAAGKFSQMVKMGEDAIDVLIKLLSDKDMSVKKGAAKALKQIGVPRSVRQLVEDIDMMGNYTIFRLPKGTFSLDDIGLRVEHFREKYYLLKVIGCDEEQKRHIFSLYPEAEIIDEKDAI